MVFFWDLRRKLSAFEGLNGQVSFQGSGFTRAERLWPAGLEDATVVEDYASRCLHLGPSSAMAC